MQPLAALATVLLIPACSGVERHDRRQGGSAGEIETNEAFSLGGQGSYTVQNGLRVFSDQTFCSPDALPLLTDVYRPDSEAALPLVIYVHGGGFGVGDHEMGIDPWLAAMSQKGYVTASIDYRLGIRPDAGPSFYFNDGDPGDDRLQVEAKFPAAVQDVKCAIRYFRAMSATYGVDPNKIGLLGTSAGGSLALMGSLTQPVDGLEGDGPFAEQSSAVQAVVDVFGSTNHVATSDWLVTPKGNQLVVAKKVLRDYIGVGPGDPAWPSPDAERSSPITYVNSGDLPVMIVHGSGDFTVPIAQGNRLRAALLLRNVPSRMVTLLGVAHERDRALACAAADYVDFFDHHLKGTVWKFPLDSAKPCPP